MPFLMLLASLCCGGQRRVSAGIHPQNEAYDNDNGASPPHNIATVDRYSPEACHEEKRLPRIIRSTCQETSEFIEWEEEGM